MTLSDLLWIGAVLGAAIVMLLLLKLYKGLATSSPEWIRKLAHISTGGLAICFPWIFSSSLPVYLVCGLSVLLLVSIRVVRPMRAQFSGVLNASIAIPGGNSIFQSPLQFSLVSHAETSSSISFRFWYSPLRMPSERC